MDAEIGPFSKLWIIGALRDPSRIIGCTYEKSFAEIRVGTHRDEIYVGQIDFLPERDQQRPDVA